MEQVPFQKCSKVVILAAHKSESGLELFVLHGIVNPGRLEVGFGKGQPSSLQYLASAVKAASFLVI